MHVFDLGRLQFKVQNPSDRDRVKLVVVLVAVFQFSRGL